jgi:TolB-like protein
MPRSRLVNLQREEQRRVIPLSRARGVANSGELFELQLLGPLSIRKGGRAERALPKKAQALLAYLAMQDGRAVPREQLAELLWGSRGEEQARRSLRQCLMSVRAAVKGTNQILTAEGDGIALTPGDALALDVTAFQRLSTSQNVDDLSAAQALYRGEFLSGLAITSEPFAEWMLIERRRIAAAMSDVLYRLAAGHAQAGATEESMPIAERLVAFDPLREDGNRLLMRLLAAVGRRSAALKHYARCVESLRRDLGVAPEPATIALADAIRDSRIEPASAAPKAASAKPMPALPEKPSIAVLPFANLSADAAQDYFAEGMVEDIALTLGRVPWLFVIASSAAAGFRGRDTDVRQIGSELGVRYVLRGSVRTSGESVRVVVQLIEASQGRHIWAERFESKRRGVFAIQDRVTNQVTAMIAPAVESVEIERAQHKPTDNLTAYDLYLQALQRFRTDFAGNKAALRLLYRAIELDPSYSAAYGLAARCYHLQTVFGWARPSDRQMQEGFRLARIAAEIGQNDSEALWMAGHNLAQVAGEVEFGLALIDRSLALNPNSASAWVSSCFVRTFLLQTDTALDHFARAQRLNPLDARHHIHWNAAARAFFAAGRLDEADAATNRTLVERPTYPPALRIKVVIAGLRGRTEAARVYLQRLLAVQPNFTVDWMRAFFEPVRTCFPDVVARYLEGARRSGVPER